MVVSALTSINAVNRHRARLILGWVTDSLTGKPSWYVTSHQVNSAFRPSGVGKSSTDPRAGVKARRVYLCRVGGNKYLMSTSEYSGNENQYISEDNFIDKPSLSQSSSVRAHVPSLTTTL